MKPVKAENTQYDQYEELLLERDRVRKEAGQVWTVYVKTFGQLMTNVFEEKVACIRQKKLIGYYQAAANRGEAIDAGALDRKLEQEMSAYQAELRRMIKEHKECMGAGVSTNYEVERAKTLYRRLAKLLHPDIRPETDREEVLMKLWVRITESYGCNDVKALAELEVLARKALADLAIDTAARVEIPDLEDRIAQVRKEIEDIKSKEPYTYRALLEDEEAVERKKQELTSELETYKKYHKELTELTEKILREGGVQIIWRMD